MEDNKYNFKILSPADYRIEINAIAKDKMIKVALDKAINGFNFFSTKPNINKNTELPEYFELPEHLFNLANNFMKGEVKKILSENEREIRNKFSVNLLFHYPFLKSGKFRKLKDGSLEMNVLYEGVYNRK